MIAKTVGNSLVLDNSKVKLLILNENDDLEKIVKKSSADIVISVSSSDQTIEGVDIVNSPGEYEIKDVLFFVNSTQNDEQNDIVAVDISGIKLVYLSSRVKKINKVVKDLLGINHLLFIDLKNREDMKVSDLVNEIEPEFLIPLAVDKEKVANLAKELGLKMDEEVSKFTITSATLNSDDPVMTIVNLK